MYNLYESIITLKSSRSIKYTHFSLKSSKSCRSSLLKSFEKTEESIKTESIHVLFIIL